MELVSVPDGPGGGLSKYTSVKSLAQGTFGQILEAVHIKDRIAYCIKRVILTGLTETELKDTFNEVRVLSQTNHPNIIEYKESFLQENALHIVMELAVEGDLALKIQHHKDIKCQIPEALVWNIFIQITIGLDYLHRRRILHRDLKPKNVFIHHGGQIKIGDLGFGKILLPHQNMAYSGVGTPIYFSPELCAGHAYDARIDVWALGCIVHELATLEAAFDASNYVALTDKIMRRPPKPLPENYSVELQTLVSQMLNKNQLNRPYIEEILQCPAIGIRLELQRYRQEHQQLQAQTQDAQEHASSLHAENESLTIEMRRCSILTQLPISETSGVPTTTLKSPDRKGKQAHTPSPGTWKSSDFTCLEKSMRSSDPSALVSHIRALPRVYQHSSKLIKMQQPSGQLKSYPYLDESTCPGKAVAAPHDESSMHDDRTPTKISGMMHSPLTHADRVSAVHIANTGSGGAITALTQDTRRVVTQLDFETFKGATYVVKDRVGHAVNALHDSHPHDAIGAPHVHPLVGTGNNVGQSYPVVYHPNAYSSCKDTQVPGAENDASTANTTLTSPSRKHTRVTPTPPSTPPRAGGCRKRGLGPPLRVPKTRSPLRVHTAPGKDTFFHQRGTTTPHGSANASIISPQFVVWSPSQEHRRMRRKQATCAD